jgi:hypothetical protein
VGGRIQRKQAAWKQQEGNMKGQFYSFLPRNIVRARHLREAKKKGMQQDLDGAWSEHACSSASQPLQEECFILEACQGEVFYLGLECMKGIELDEDKDEKVISPVAD